MWLLPGKKQKCVTIRVARSGHLSPNRRLLIQDSWRQKFQFGDLATSWRLGALLILCIFGPFPTPHFAQKVSRMLLECTSGAETNGTNMTEQIFRQMMVIWQSLRQISHSDAPPCNATYRCKLKSAGLFSVSGTWCRMTHASKPSSSTIDLKCNASVVYESLRFHAEGGGVCMALYNRHGNVNESGKTWCGANAHLKSFLFSECFT